LLPGLDRSQLDGLTLGLADHVRSSARRLPGATTRLRRSKDLYAEALAGADAVLCPVVAGVTPRLGQLSPNLPIEELLPRLIGHVAFTPLNNATGSPAISLPLGETHDGLPIGVQLMGPHGGERTLLELAFALEAAAPFRRLGTARSFRSADPPRAAVPTTAS
jgi:amidase